ncbi:MAG TPA: hypothetical protein VE569_07655 [Acidimicrobiia bacterium]|jgi:hypothetical protein|nr:hypothetical protein [Acidimicrobiia bacterium]
MLTRSPATPGTQAGIALLTVGVTAFVVYIVGIFILPTAAIQQSPGDPGFHPPTVQDLSGTQAVFVVLGDRDAQLELNRVASVGEYNPGKVGDTPIDLSLTYRSSEASLLLSAKGLTVDRPATGGSAEAVLGWEGSNYFATNGECTITLETRDHTILEPLLAVRDGVPRGEPIPTYAGTFLCTDVKELRGDGSVTIQGAFQFDPQE